jgi:hypothetical protein
MLTYDDFAALGEHLYKLSQMTYSRVVVFIDRVRQLR